MSDQSDDWFIYSRSAGRVTAIPANGKGWAAFLLLLTATITLGYIVIVMASGLHLGVRLVALSVVIVGGVLAILRLAIAKGRQVS